jgi:hypothetical protein
MGVAGAKPVRLERRQRVAAIDQPQQRIAAVTVGSAIQAKMIHGRSVCIAVTPMTWAVMMAPRVAG